MRLVYTDPIAELKILINKFNQFSNVSHIALSAQEMRACLDHPKAEEVFPSFMQTRNAELEGLHRQSEALKLAVRELDEKDLQDGIAKSGDVSAYGKERQELFDALDFIAEKELEIKQKYPKLIREGKILFKVTMN